MPFGRDEEPELSPTLSEFAAYCDPSFSGDLACEKVLRITGDTDAKANRKIRVSHLRQHHRRHRFHNNIAQRDGRSR
jgi:hypothetical protein